METVFLMLFAVVEQDQRDSSETVYCTSTVGNNDGVDVYWLNKKKTNT